MKMFLVLVLSVAALFLWQRQGKENVVATDAASAVASPAPSQPRAVSGHNWAKNSLDRAHEVAGQVQQSREQNDER